ncbi:MAG TPA: DEAD/DEAH box helicase [Streptosporangiaceae bacterium]|nr:DEAD/DEAH box helicase [Streptosporangiaceae bacterium]
MPPTILMTQLTPSAAPDRHEMTVLAAIVGAMGQGTTLDFDLATLRRAIGGGSYVRGTEYARQRAVLHVAWDPGDSALRGTVQGQGGHVYRTAAFLTLPAGQPAKFDMGECSCPVAFNCKHVVALVMTAVGSGTIEPGRPAAPRDAAWDQSLDTLLDPGAEPGPGATALAVELALTGGASEVTWGGPVPLSLTARLVRPGRNGWVAGDLSWARLEALRGSPGHSSQQVRLLRELYALYQASSEHGGLHGYQYGQDRSIEFSAIGSRQLWPLLDEARAAGLALVYPGQLGVLTGYDEASFCLDVARGEDGAVRIVPVISTGDTDAAVPVVFIGADGHGAVYVDRDQDRDGDPGQWPFRLARLARAVPPALQRMALQGSPLRVPAADEPRFLQQYYPRLRQAATLTSSDGSFRLPSVSGPELVLSARYGDGHELDLSWEWEYRVGDSVLRAPLPPEDRTGGYRDAAAERTLLSGLDATGLPLREYGLLRPAAGVGRPLTATLLPRTRLTGMATMRFTTGLLPRLQDQPGVTVEITGEPADYREAGESLRIAVSTTEVAGDNDWFDLGVTITVEGREVPFLDVFLALSRGDTQLLLPDGAYFTLDQPELRALARLIDEARSLLELPPDQLRISPYQAGFWDELASLGVVARQAASWREQVDGLLSATVTEPAPVPAGVQAQLRPYQEEGFGWLSFLWEHRLGGILADDMGLGKTLQCLALISHARERHPDGGPFLIVAPTSVVANWVLEAARFTPDLRVVPISATTGRRGPALSELAAGADAVVTSYTLLRTDFAAYSGLTWSGLLLDEAQHAKNRQSKVYQCARRLTAPTKIAITGTPLENNLMELWSLLSIAAPGLFPSPERFREYYSKPVERMGDRQRLAQLQQRIRPLVLRRVKEQVAADLPAKQEQVLEVDLHPQHRKVYQTRLQRERHKVLGLIGDLNSNRFAIFRSLTLLRQLSLHAGLVDDNYAELASAKIDTLSEHLGEVIAGGHRALVFSQFTGFLGKVRERLEADGIGYCYLDGSTRDRAAEVARFKDSATPVFLISLKAGGFGLNLTEADYCFLLDPWWNPATEAQAVDRTHRIGQRRNVMVYRLVARDTIEEKVMALKARKAQLFSDVLGDAGTFGGTLSDEDIRALLD